MAGRRLETVVEAILFSSEAALTPARIAEALERQDATPDTVRQAVNTLNEEYRRSDRAFEIIEVAGGYKMMTLPEYNHYIRAVLRSRSRDRLSQAAMESLAIVAYRQPISRAEIESIRGVDAGPILRMLVDRGLVRIVGRSESLGHPLLYGTTTLFLELFGLSSLDALPRAEELLAKEAAGEEETEADESAEAAPSSEGAAALADAMASLGHEPTPGEQLEAETPTAAELAHADEELTSGGRDESLQDRPDIIRLANHQEPPAETDDENDKE